MSYLDNILFPTISYLAIFRKFKKNKKKHQSGYRRR
jgi:hypothetical protein